MPLTSKIPLLALLTAVMALAPAAPSCAGEGAAQPLLLAKLEKSNHGGTPKKASGKK